MNILLVTTRLNIGGVGVYVTSLAKALNGLGHKVVVASSGGPLKSGLDGCGIKHIDLPIDTSFEFGLGVASSVKTLSKVVKEEKIDIVHAHTRVSQVVAYFAVKKSLAKFVTTCHGFFRPKFIRKILPCWGHGVIAISDAVYSHLVDDFGVSIEKIELIYNGIDINLLMQEFNNSKKVDVAHTLGVDAKFVIGNISRLSSVKGHEFLIRALAEIKREIEGVKILFVGGGKKSYKGKLIELAKSLCVADDLIFLEETQQVGEALSLFDIFVLPSIQEGLGLALIEALAVGLPVVASDVGGIDSLIEDKKTGLLVAPADERLLAKAIIGLCRNMDYAESLANAGQKKVSESFTLDIMAVKTVEFYKKTLESNPSLRGSK